MAEEKKIRVEYLTRVEGHGNIVVDLKDGVLQECRLDIVEAPRFFEGLLRGRSIFEAQHISCRICGICSCGHTLASIQAAEDAIGFKPSKQTEDLRKALLSLEILDSHLLHIYLLAAPDFLGVKSFVPLLATHNDVVRRALNLKRALNEVCEIFVGRHIHPISSIVGGFTRLPRAKELDGMIGIMEKIRGDIYATVDLGKLFSYPDFERDTEYVALVNDEEEYPLLSGDIGSSDGVRLNKKDYRKATNEFIVPYSSAKHAKLSRTSFMTGALARFNINNAKLRPEAKKAAKDIGLSPKCVNPYKNTAAQIVEVIHCYEDILHILKTYKAKSPDYSEEVIVGLNEKGTIPVKAGSGVGAVEVPRGLLYHHYKVDGKGIINDADCIIPTGQNLENIEQDMKTFVPKIAGKSEQEITHLLEMLVRAYDPCISCSAHFLNIKYKK